MHYQLERSHGCRVSDAWTYRGLRTVVLENEVLRVVILIDKGADIYPARAQAHRRGLPVALPLGSPGPLQVFAHLRVADGGVA